MIECNWHPLPATGSAWQPHWLSTKLIAGDLAYYLFSIIWTVWGEVPFPPAFAREGWRYKIFSYLFPESDNIKTGNFLQDGKALESISIGSMTACLHAKWVDICKTMSSGMLWSSRRNKLGSTSLPVHLYGVSSMVIACLLLYIAFFYWDLQELCIIETKTNIHHLVPLQPLSLYKGSPFQKLSLMNFHIWGFKCSLYFYILASIFIDI